MVIQKNTPNFLKNKVCISINTTSTHFFAKKQKMDI